MDVRSKTAILKSYLGASPAWFDLRKKELIKDRIDIDQWLVNMNYLILRCGTIDRNEQEALDNWVKQIEDEHKNDEWFDSEEHLDQKATTLVKRIEGNDTLVFPQFLWKDQDRNWFLAAYPDVCDFIYPMYDFTAEDRDKNARIIEQLHMEKRPILESMAEYIEQKGKYTQTIFLIRMKDYYKNVLNRDFLLTERNQ